MRRLISIIIGAVLLLGLNVNLFAKTSVLLDFDLLKANGYGPFPDESKDKGEMTWNEHLKKDVSKGEPQHMATLVDYSGIAGSNYTEDDVQQMNISLSANNWVISLNSSAQTVENKRYSDCIEWHTKYVSVLKPVDLTSDYQEPEGFNILGVRIHFSDGPFNNWALIAPPFSIPAYEDNWTDYKGQIKDEYKDADGNLDRSLITMESGDRGSKFLNGYGVVRNVGLMKSMSMTIYGCNFKNSISVLLADEYDIVTEYSMPQYLDFDGWRRISWNNPNYLDDAASRDLYIVPLYPRPEPYVKLEGFRVYRQGDQFGGDFITYIKDVTITYDEAVLDRPNIPIDHEDAWGILQARTEDSKKREYNKLGQTQILQYLERQKMDSYAQ